MTKSKLEIFVNSCGLLRKHELYKIAFTFFKCDLFQLKAYTKLKAVIMVAFAFKQGTCKSYDNACLHLQRCSFVMLSFNG